ncbi:MAG: trypsin-like peptidase domain-containing protein [Alicyclobacillus herbarius]|uniref:S1C family serine protease n=1 Tax=Alicyclobacillus herbarius TaxID=122960 RepID=UPI0023529DE1|nr:trypsin-like peptidase domain-containing protein [Alicyclobacillus herbarius]MCL6631750.1 trypsin-like peptidase domain-containing protein [Alicyclobacillus herbarius]
MGFYKDSDDWNAQRKDRRTGLWRWAGVVVLSALVGSAATMALYPSLQGRDVITTTADAATENRSVTLPASANVSVNDAIVEAVKKAKPAVVGVLNYKEVSDFFSQQTKLKANDVGTGLLFHKDSKYGYIVTNNHVVDGGAKVEVVFEKGKHVTAEVVGTDEFTDLAVLRVPIKYVSHIQPAQFANSDSIQVGEPAIAIGSPMGLDFADSVTAGIVSAKKRIMPVQTPDGQQVLDYQAVIQTDAAINPGNSGGPLLNINGQVIGINSSKIVDPTVEGMGFAIPSNEVKTIAAEIMATGHAEHPALGVSGYSLRAVPEQWWPDVPVDYGILVQEVQSESAKQSGLKPGDVIVAINGHAVQTMPDLRTYLFQAKPGETVMLTVYRGHKKMDFKVTLGKMETPNTTVGGASQSNAGGNDPFSIPSEFFN